MSPGSWVAAPMLSWLFVGIETPVAEGGAIICDFGRFVVTMRGEVSVLCEEGEERSKEMLKKYGRRCQLND